MNKINVLFISAISLSFIHLCGDIEKRVLFKNVTDYEFKIKLKDAKAMESLIILGPIGSKTDSVIVSLPRVKPTLRSPKYIESMVVEYKKDKIMQGHKTLPEKEIIFINELIEEIPEKIEGFPSFKLSYGNVWLTLQQDPKKPTGAAIGVIVETIKKK